MTLALGTNSTAVTNRSRQSQNRMRRFVQEARTASSLSHPNVAQIFQIEEIVMTWC